MQQAESSRDTVQRRKNSRLRDAFVFSLWRTSRRQTIAVIGGQCRSRADNLQRDTVEAGRAVNFHRELVLENATSGSLKEFQYQNIMGTPYAASTAVWLPYSSVD